MAAPSRRTGESEGNVQLLEGGHLAKAGGSSAAISKLQAAFPRFWRRSQEARPKKSAKRSRKAGSYDDSDNDVRGAARERPKSTARLTHVEKEQERRANIDRGVTDLRECLGPVDPGAHVMDLACLYESACSYVEAIQKILPADTLDRLAENFSAAQDRGRLLRTKAPTPSSSGAVI